MDNAIHIRSLRAEDVFRWNVDTQGIPRDQLVAVDVEDLAACLAAVVYTGPSPQLLWSDADGKGAPIEDGPAFAVAVATLVGAVV